MHLFTSQKSPNRPYKQIIRQHTDNEMRLHCWNINSFLSSLACYIASSGFFPSLEETGGENSWKSREIFTLRDIINVNT